MYRFLLSARLVDILVDRGQSLTVAVPVNYDMHPNVSKYFSKRERAYLQEGVIDLVHLVVRRVARCDESLEGAHEGWDHLLEKEIRA